MWYSEISVHAVGGMIFYGAAELGYHECALSQVDPHPDMTLDVARTENTDNQPTSHFD